jgi:hypothetical protein
MGWRLTLCDHFCANAAQNGSRGIVQPSGTVSCGQRPAMEPQTAHPEVGGDISKRRNEQ